VLYIIVPVHNCLNKTKNFIKSLKRQSYSNYHLIVVNDGSTDGTGAFLDNFKHELTVLQGDGNLWWGGSINLALEYVREYLTDNDYVAFANNDVTLFENTISILLSECAKNRKALFHPLVVDQNGKIVSCGCKVGNWAFFLTQHPFRNQLGNSKTNCDNVSLDMMTARFLIFHSSLLNYVKGIDLGHFPHYSGDHDFCLMARKHNYSCFLVPRSMCMLDTATSGINPNIIRSFEQFINSLSSIKSTNNLKVRLSFALKHCPSVFLISHLVSVFMKIFFNYIRYNLSRNQ
jgi:GT2 family glycosyltransferase